MSRRDAGLRLCVFFGLALALFGGAAAAPAGLRYLARVLPDNYSRRAEEALQKGQWRKAESIALQRIEKVWWDMNAHYLLAQALAGAGNSSAAADVMHEIQRKVVTAQGRSIRVSDYDEADTLRRLAEYLWADGRHQYAGEMFRAAIDAGSAEAGAQALSLADSLPPDLAAAEAVAGVALKLQSRSQFEKALKAMDQAASAQDRAIALTLRARWLEEADKNPSGAVELLTGALLSSPDGAAVLQQPVTLMALSGTLRRSGFAAEASEIEIRLYSDTSVRTVGLDAFADLPVGAAATSSTLRMSRRGTASGRLETGVFRSKDLLICASGAPAFGQWPMLSVGAGGKEITRLYLDGFQPNVRRLPLFPEGMPKILDLNLTFLNDAYDPVTRADRDVTISYLAFQ